ncbi:MAG: DNA polymerase IV [Gammaproteobacteria bacterium]|nr:DNA polymerase IV [Gammaproteobacteria bacterium]
MIIHIDMDAFYASVEERDHPELKEKPVVVGGTPEGRGVVAAANYESRKFGLHSAMPAITARRLCPQAVFLPVRMDYYVQVSQQIRKIFARYTPLVEPLSLDEAFLDVSASKQLFGTATKIGRRIKEEIAGELNLTASVGVAPNKFLAKLASDIEKPNGFVVVNPEDVQPFLEPLAVTRLWGVGKQAARKLAQLDIDTIGALRRQPRELLIELFGNQGSHLLALARGIDPRTVVPDHRAKSISHETTFATDVTDIDVLRSTLLTQTEQVARRLRRQELRGRTVILKLRFSDFRTLTRSQSLADPTHSTHEVWRCAASLLQRTLTRKQFAIRLLGMGVSGFGTPDSAQGDLFYQRVRDKQAVIDVTTDRINERFGRTAVRRGLSKRNPHND